MANYVINTYMFNTLAKSYTGDLLHDVIVMNKGEILPIVSGPVKKNLDDKTIEELPENTLFNKGRDKIIEFMNHIKRVYE